jgi:hypothetical protein
LEDVYKKLGLNNVEEAESVCAKAIFDGVIDATIDFDQQALLSNDTLDIYCTSDPYQTFHKRITFCLDVHNEVRTKRHIFAVLTRMSSFTHLSLSLPSRRSKPCGTLLMRIRTTLMGLT